MSGEVLISELPRSKTLSAIMAGKSSVYSLMPPELSKLGESGITGAASMNRHSRSVLYQG